MLRSGVSQSNANSHQLTLARERAEQKAPQPPVHPDAEKQKRLSLAFERFQILSNLES
jgi:hypothetical protein